MAETQKFSAAVGARLAVFRRLRRRLADSPKLQIKPKNYEITVLFHHV